MSITTHSPKIKRVPRMRGSSVETRLRNLVKWRNDNIPAGVGLTLDQIGSAVGLTRERVRQIEARALKRLRHPSRLKLIDE